MFGLYLHVPFCEKKCSYCDFYSIESTSHIDLFVECLLQELKLRSPMYDGSPITSIFFGGGTPSLLSPDAIHQITQELQQRFAVAADAEWTMECNPGTVTESRLAGYRKSGINRVSFGVQSFTSAELEFLDRIHSASEAEQAMMAARDVGFDNVNMDVMFAVPGQTLNTLSYNLERLIQLQPDHVSAYSLIYERGTPLYTQLKKGLVSPIPEELDAEMYHMVIRTLTNAGYEQYEVSNFSKPGKACRHNLTYWHAEPYLAVGPSAHGFIGNTRYWNKRSLTAWMADVRAGVFPEANREELGPNELLSEYLFLHLRADGISLADVWEKFNVDLQTSLQPDLTYWLEEGFITISHGLLRLTSEGYRVCDELTVKLMEKIAS